MRDFKNAAGANVGHGDRRQVLGREFLVLVGKEPARLAQPGALQRIAHHLDFPDYPAGDLLRIADTMLEQQNYRFGPGARAAFEEYLAHRIPQPHFANARSVRNALDRARLRQASRLFADQDREFTPDDLSMIAESDIRASRVFAAVAAPA